MLDIETPVRIHKSILLRHKAAKLWYFARVADPEGRGRVELTPSDLELLGVSKSTIYRWLREGRAIGLFRIYEFRPDGSLYISLGGLPKVCKKSGMGSWGPVTTVPLREILEGLMRCLASAIQIQDLQEKSRYAAGHSLNELERRCFKISSATEMLSLTSPIMARGVMPGLAHVGPEKIFVGRSFIPFGVSQRRICAELNAETRSCGICPRTLRNHLKRLGVNRRQLVQAKPEYKEVSAAIQWEAQGHKVKGDVDIWFQREGDQIRLNEPNGKSSARREGGHLLKPERLFRYFGADWLYRCNLYALSYELTSMRRSRHEYKKLRDSPGPVPVENSAPVFTPQTPLRELLRAGPTGAALSNHNKEEKNDNPELEPVSDDNSVDWLAKCREQIERVKARRDQERFERWWRLHHL